MAASLLGALLAQASHFFPPLPDIATPAEICSVDIALVSLWLRFPVCILGIRGLGVREALRCHGNVAREAPQREKIAAARNASVLLEFLPASDGTVLPWVRGSLQY